MKKLRLDARRLGLLAVAVGVCFAACTGTGSLEIDLSVKTPIAQGGAQIRYEPNDTGGTDVKLDKSPHDVRVDVEFLDAEGKLVADSGAVGVSPGDKVEIPEGAKTVTISGESDASECTGCSGDGGSGGGGGMYSPSIVGCGAHPCASALARGQAGAQRGAASGSTKEYFSFGFPIEPALTAGDLGATSNTAWSIRFTDLAGLDAAQIYSRVAPVVEGEAFATPLVPSSMVIENLTKMVPKALGLGATLICKDHSAQPFQLFEMAWNGAFYADLNTNSALHSLPNSWHAVEVDIPLQDFNLVGTSGSSNQIRVRTQTVEDPAPTELEVSAFFF